MFPVNNILFLDIETVPQQPSYKELPDEWKKLWELKAQYLIRNKEDETCESIYPRAGIYAEFGKIICISCGFIHGAGGSKKIILKSFAGDDEKKLLLIPTSRYAFMKRFLSSVGFCLFLLFVGFFAFLPSSNAEQDLIGQMLELPAPPPPNPFYKPVRRYRDPDFYSSAKVPDDEAPIEDLMDYWARQNQIDRGRGYAQKVSDKSLERIMKEIEEDPERLLQYVNRSRAIKMRSNSRRRFTMRN